MNSETSKHTPGPWAAADKAAWFRGQTDPDEGKIAITAGSCGVVANAYGRGNAHLIAAAPDMLAELEVREGDLFMLRKAIEAGDPKAELLIRVEDMLRETRACLSRAEGKAS